MWSLVCDFSEHDEIFRLEKKYGKVWNLSLHDYREEHKSYLQGVVQLVTFWFRWDIWDNNFQSRTKDHILYSVKTLRDWNLLSHCLHNELEIFLYNKAPHKNCIILNNCVRRRRTQSILQGAVTNFGARLPSMWRRFLPDSSHSFGWSHICAVFVTILNFMLWLNAVTRKFVFIQLWAKSFLLRSPVMKWSFQSKG